MTTIGSAQKGIPSTLSPRRIIVNVALTANFYLFYWVYLTWKQIKVETGRDYHPVWHTLALLIPIYGLFVFHRHLLQLAALELQRQDELSPTLAAALALDLRREQIQSE